MKTVITISREYGSGGRMVAQRVAETLEIPFYDKEIIERVAGEAGFTQSFVQNTEERPINSLIYGLYFSAQNLSPTDQIFVAQASVVRKLADKGPCVIVGRCADFILRGRPNLLRAFLYAPMEERVLRAHQEYGLEGKNLEGLIVKQDKRRAAYYDYFTNTRWGDSHAYDLCINTTMGLDTAAQLICAGARAI